MAINESSDEGFPLVFTSILVASFREWPFNKGLVGLNFNLISGKRVEETRPARCLSCVTHGRCLEVGVFVSCD